MRDTFYMALVISARKLKFEAHPIVVVIEQPMKRILSNPTHTGRLTKWAIKLSKFEITFVPRTGIKTQALADFIIECTARDPQESQEYIPELPERPQWNLYIDGAMQPEKPFQPRVWNRSCHTLGSVSAQHKTNLFR
uniref:Reverse transcriptase RNase H-like domain-containing protein n=1 Tax=Lithospermum erythrorhizon TaxID=34254 RepID=A0AAV3P4F0_LITER